MGHSKRAIKAKQAKDFDYKAAMRELRGKVGFDYPLNRRLNRGQKAAISKAYRSLKEIEKFQTQPVEIPRKRNETREHYKNRFRRERERLSKHGLTPEHSKALHRGAKHFLLVGGGAPKGAHARLVNGRVEITSPNARHYRSVHIPAEPTDVLDDPYGAMAAAFSEAVSMGLRPSEIAIANGPYRWRDSIGLEDWYDEGNTLDDYDENELYEYLEDVGAFLSNALEQYSKTGNTAAQTNAVTGFIIIQR